MKEEMKQFQECLTAINKDSVETLKGLLDNLKDINMKDKDGRTLLFYAILTHNYDIVELLISHNCDLNIRDNLGWTPLHYAVQEDLLEITKLLLDKKADINIVDNYGNTPISRAVFNSRGRGEIILLLRAYNANPNIKNNSGVSAIDLANKIANFNVIQFFE
jgi:ankyrin repeat protein